MEVLRVEQGKQLSFSEAVSSYFKVIGTLGEYADLSLFKAWQLGSIEKASATLRKKPTLSKDDEDLKTFHYSVYDTGDNKLPNKMAQFTLGAVATTYKFGKKNKAIPTYTGRDGIAFYLASAMLGRECIYIPAWSSKVYIHKVNHLVPENPVFLDTGYAGSLFKKLHIHRFGEFSDIPEYPMFLIACGNWATREDKRQYLPREHATNRRDWNQLIAGRLEELMHPVQAANHKGEFTKYSSKVRYILIMVQLSMLWTEMQNVLRTTNKWR